MTHAPFETWLHRWRLVPDGVVIARPSSSLLPVLRDGTPARLKVAATEEERRGALLMEWYAGQGAARVLEREAEALLLERLECGNALTEMAKGGHDDAVTEIICQVVSKLHAPRADQPPTLVPLSIWFQPLELAANRYGGLLEKAATTARELLGTPRDIVALHGDIHHGNILGGIARGWLAVDPKGLRGERGFDSANIFFNPDFATATGPGRLRRLAEIVAKTAGLEIRRVLSWILAYAGLSAAWSVDDGENPRLALAIAEFASAELK